MFISQQLRKNNIAEYIIYMWHIEDIIRAYQCSITQLKSNYLNKFSFTKEQEEEVIDWYGNLIKMMNSEGKRENGHLQINEIIVKDLAELHAKLLDSNKFPFYNAEYFKVLPFIVELRNKGGKDVNEIATCLNALYGIMLLRLQKKVISTETNSAINEISTLIGMLSDYYKKDKTEGLEFE